MCSADLMVRLSTAVLIWRSVLEITGHTSNKTRQFILNHCYLAPAHRADWKIKLAGCYKIFGYLSGSYILANAALAQPLSGENSAQGLSPNVIGRTAYCTQSNLSSSTFIRKLNEIIKHGDLTDVGFTEKTLDLRFRLSYGFSNGKPNSQKKIYNSDRMLGVPIQVILYISVPSQKNGHSIATLGFDSNQMTAPDPNYIFECLRISQSNFESFFGNGFSSLPVPVGELQEPGQVVEAPPTSGAEKSFGDFAKGGSRIGIGFNYDTSSLMVTNVGIGQDQ